MTDNWWFYTNGSNFLEVMPDTGFDYEGVFGTVHYFYTRFIIDSLKRIPQAAEDLDAAVNLLSADKQAQIALFLEANPIYARPLESPKDISDRVQAKQNTAGIRTVGARGGSRIGG